MTNWRFTEEYDEIRSQLKSTTVNLSKSDQQIVDSLLLMLDESGPSASHAKALDQLRKACKRGFFQKLFGSAADLEADALLKLAGDSANKNKRAAALKNLRHMYLLSKFGGKDTWMLSLPKSYSAWPTDEMENSGNLALKVKLKDVNEYHSTKEMRDLQAASQKAIAWAQKAAAVCGGGQTSKQAKALISRWFLDEDHQKDEDIDKIRKQLCTGFGKISSAAGSGRMVLTDNPKYRGTQHENSEAFVITSGERLNVIYIEKAFFNSNNTLTGMKNWARIIVHELSHSQLNTDDVKIPGDTHARYSWHPKGIRARKANYHTDLAITNADNWAFFCADAAGELTETERNTALKPNVP